VFSYLSLSLSVCFNSNGWGLQWTGRTEALTPPSGSADAPKSLSRRLTWRIRRPGSSSPATRLLREWVALPTFPAKERPAFPERARPGKSSSQSSQSQSVPRSLRRRQSRKSPGEARGALLSPFALTRCGSRPVAFPSFVDDISTSVCVSPLNFEDLELVS
jgi:hypothetical protein